MHSLAICVMALTAAVELLCTPCSERQITMGTTLPRARAAWTPRDPHTQALHAELESRVRGEVRFEKGSRALYATDASNYRQVPIGVVMPRDADDVVETMRICHQHHVPVLSRGAGTSQAGQTCNVAVVLDYSKFMNT